MECPNCGSDNWALGPEGGGSQNILCINFLSKYCESPFGLDALAYNPDRIRALYC